LWHCAARQRRLIGLTIFDAEPMTEYVAASLFGEDRGEPLERAERSWVVAGGNRLYSVMAYAVTQRTSEIGIRVTLGAQQGTSCAGDSARIAFAAAGLFVGSLAAAALARLVAAMLVGVGPADPQVYAAAAAFTVLVTLVSAAIPAWRALRVDPALALRWQ